ncbi:hypothetical protein CWE27_13675 [Streptomyces sp. EAG2]|nr:hypothetical protein CWE27_13675 [Streptomyces sp. EAG2]
MRWSGGRRPRCRAPSARRRASRGTVRRAPAAARRTPRAARPYVPGRDAGPGGAARGRHQAAAARSAGSCT